jgi:hypothetical protein
MDQSAETALQQQIHKLVQSQNATTEKLDVLCKAVNGLVRSESHAPTQVLSATASTSQHRHQRARTETNSVPALARDEVLDTVFDFVGIGEYYYVAGVCRNWRGRYMTLCHKATTTPTPDCLSTTISRALITKARLQLAFDIGLTIDKLDTSKWWLAETIVGQSLQPEKVIKLARLYGMQ